MALESGANPNASQAARPVFLYACLNNDLKSVKVLLRYGADPRVDFGAGVTTLTYLHERNIQFPSKATSKEIMALLEDDGDGGMASITEHGASVVEVAYAAGDRATDGATAASPQVDGTQRAMASAVAVDGTQPATTSDIVATDAAKITAPQSIWLVHSIVAKSIQVDLGGDAVTLGREWLVGNPVRCRIIIKRRHCEVWMAHDGVVFVRDLDTVHGTYLGGNKRHHMHSRKRYHNMHCTALADRFARGGAQGLRTGYRAARRVLLLPGAELIYT